MTGGYTSEATRLHYSRQSWWPIVFDLGRPWVGDYRFDDDGQGYLEIVAPVVDKDNVIGELKVMIGASPWFGSAQSIIGKTGHVMLLSDTGMVLACPLLPATAARIARAPPPQTTPTGIEGRTAAILVGGICVLRRISCWA